MEGTRDPDVSSTASCFRWSPNEVGWVPSQVDCFRDRSDESLGGGGGGRVPGEISDSLSVLHGRQYKALCKRGQCTSRSETARDTTGRRRAAASTTSGGMWRLWDMTGSDSTSAAATRVHWTGAQGARCSEPSQHDSRSLLRRHRLGPREPNGRAYVLLVEILGRLDGHGRAAKGASSIGPDCVARARTPGALGRSMAADLTPRHGRGSGRAPETRCSSRGGGGRAGAAGVEGSNRGLLAQKGLGRLLHRGGTAARGGLMGRRGAGRRRAQTMDGGRATGDETGRGRLGARWQRGQGEAMGRARSRWDGSERARLQLLWAPLSMGADAHLSRA